MSKDSFGGGRSTESVTLEHDAPTRPPEVEHYDVDAGGDNAPPIVADDLAVAEQTVAEQTLAEQTVAELVDDNGDSDSVVGGGSTTTPKLIRANRRQLVSQIAFGLALGSVMFFLFGNSGDNVVDTNLPNVAETVRLGTEPVDDTESSNFGIGDLAAESRSALPRSDLPGATSTTLGPSQQAPLTVMVEGTDSDGGSEPIVDGDPVQDYEDDFSTFEPEVDDAPYTTGPVAANTTVPTTADLETTFVSDASTTTVAETETTAAVTTISDREEAESTTSLAESTTVPTEVEVSIVDVVDDEMSGLLLSASPDIGSYDYCWTVGYETSGESSRFCVDEANASSEEASVLGDATVALEVYTVEGVLVGSDTVTLELLAQSVLRLSGDSDAVSLAESLDVRSVERPEITQYCWNLIQGDASLLQCGDNSTESLDLDGYGFEAGPGSIRGQVYIGPEGSWRLVGSEETQINFE